MDKTPEERRRTRIHQHRGWLCRLFKALARTELDNFLQSAGSFAVSRAGSRPDPHTVYLLSLKELRPIWLPGPRDVCPPPLKTLPSGILWKGNVLHKICAHLRYTPHTPGSWILLHEYPSVKCVYPLTQQFNF